MNPLSSEPTDVGSPRPGAPRPYRPPSITIIVLKSIVIAVALVAAVSVATRFVFAFVFPVP